MNSADRKNTINFFASKKIEFSEIKADLYALLIIIIFNKSFFLSNSDLKIFVCDVLGFKYSDYIYKSRTLLCSKIMKDIYEMDYDKLINIEIKINQLINVLQKDHSVEEQDFSNNKKDKKKKKISSFTADWSKVIKNLQ